ncbi:3-oxoacid CoA-transferase subunit B [Aquabacter spiritensis]|uniref:3-oxoadipate CoA-transferase beta subunit n=1 Tax=Aquabacter spiritensis TaxID=933073 RepID=A0A4R3LXY1_9HYPH|nr:3-oxoacid CoA-transferase subunit B [Aquabacter spiritensis]TCT03585.1 3-oxoadipate CoA-transferase beta subunit [Aquabacter spiritensis]
MSLDPAIKRLTRQQMAWRAAQDIADGSYVNLGIGMPELVARYVPAGRHVTYHTENGLLGFGERPPEGQEDPDLVNAGKKPVTLLPGAALFHHADSFAMIRGGHLDLSILGAFQVAQNGDLANWQAGEDAIPAVGGAMDLVSGVKQVFVLTEHTTRDGQPKLVERCSYALTGAGVVTRVFTDLAVVDVIDRQFVVREIVDGLSLDALRALTGADLHEAGAPGLLKAA